MLIESYYPVRYLFENRNLISSIKDELDKIPENASVQADSMLTTYLSDIDVLYELDYNFLEPSPHETDYVIIDWREEIPPDTQWYINILLNQNYTIIVDSPGQLLILKNENVSASSP
jgi:hypothetical protein